MSHLSKLGFEKYSVEGLGWMSVYITIANLCCPDLAIQYVITRPLPPRPDSVGWTV